jgi:hypothetical protein
MSLISNYKPERSKRTEKYRTYKTLINKHRQAYLECSPYSPIDLKYALQIASYEAVKIKTAYLNGITLQFGNKLRMILNLMTKKKERISTIKKEIKETEKSEEDELIKLAIKNVNNQIYQVKLAMWSRKLQDLPQEFLTADHLNMIRKFFDCYSNNYKFAKNYIFYDCKANPIKHLKAYHQLAKIWDALQGGKSLNCFPIKRTFIPCYMTIDTLTLNVHILKNKVISHLDKQIVLGVPFLILIQKQ